MFLLEKKSLHKITSQLTKLLGDELIVVAAFGSRVRGDSVENSDFDILVVVKKRTFQVIDIINALFLREERATGIPFSVIVKNLDSFQREKTHNTLFYRNIRGEGLILYGTA